MYLPEESQIKDFINKEFQKHFDRKVVDISQRTRLVADLYKFRQEDPFFHAQAKEKFQDFTHFILMMSLFVDLTLHSPQKQ